jgi:hypothetical protein
MQRNIIAPDFMKLVHMTSQSFHLGLAWHFTRDDQFARALRERVRAFFLDPTTGMLPNLKYAQLRPDYAVGSPVVRCPPITFTSRSCGNTVIS